MKTTTAHTKVVWASGDFAGDDRRPTTRATIQKMFAPHPQYRFSSARSQDWAHNGSYTSLLFGQADQQPRELPNIRSVKWERGVDTDVGSCTIVIGNVEARNDLDPASDAELDFPGYYTPNRGTEDFFDEWGYVTNSWRNWLVPDRLIRTYEGYGTDPDVAPEHDPYLYPSGTWLIDDVTIDTGGLITLQCRDIGRVLLDQILFAPLVPYEAYPLTFRVFEDRQEVQKRVNPANNGPWTRPAFDTDSNKYYATHPGIRDNGHPLVEADRSVYGHYPEDAFDNSTYTYWMSAGFPSRDGRNAYVWIQGELANPGYVEGIRVDAQHGPYTMYVSLQRPDGTWLGNKKVPYQAGSLVDSHADIPYVAAFNVDKGATRNFKLPKRYANIAKIRYTFGSLAWGGFGDKNCHHASINGVFYSSNVYITDQPGTFRYGNYDDYTDIVKWLLAWAGWFWPLGNSGLDTQTYSDGSTYNLTPASSDSALVAGRVWGDFEGTGTNGLVKFDVDTWDKKPVMDGISVIRDIVGFDFWIDETGGAIFRLPNIWSKGCYVMPTKGGPRTTRTTNLVEIHEKHHLINQTVKLSSRNVRDRIFVASSAGRYGAVVNTYRPDDVGLRRYAGWTDQKFVSNDECERMADLISLKQAFTYRQNQLMITANPALQPDDQVIITERTTGEGYIHRITNISSDFDNDTGQWTYSLTTNWLGSKAFTNLAFDPEKLQNPTKTYLYYMGKIAGL